MEVGRPGHGPGADVGWDAELWQLRLPVCAELEGQNVEVFGLLEAMSREKAVHEGRGDGVTGVLDEPRRAGGAPPRWCAG